MPQIDGEDGDRRPTDGCSTSQSGTKPLEMFGPEIASRVKEPCDLRGLGIEAGDVRSFVVVTREAGQGQILGNCGPGMFLGNDVIDFVRGFGECLGKTTVFAGGLCSLPDQGPKLAVHYDSPTAERSDHRAFDLTSPRKLLTRS